MINKLKIQRLVGIATLAAFVVVLQLISNYIQFGPVSITLALIPIVIGAIVYGPSAGFILGVVHGVIVTTAPATISLFMPYTVFGTIVVCLLKSGLAGLASGYVFKLFSKKNINLAVILASIVVPIVNTGLFSVACLTIFKDLIAGFAQDANVISYLFLTFIGYNFLIEFFVNSVLSPVLIRIVRMYDVHKKFGSDVEF